MGVSKISKIDGLKERRRGEVAFDKERKCATLVRHQLRTETDYDSFFSGAQLHVLRLISTDLISKQKECFAWKWLSALTNYFGEGEPCGNEEPTKRKSAGIA